MDPLTSAGGYSSQRKGGADEAAGVGRTEGGNQPSGQQTLPLDKNRFEGKGGLLTSPSPRFS